MSERILFVPSSRPGLGTGHLHRALRLAGRLSGLRTTGIYLSPEAQEAARFIASRLPEHTEFLRQEPEEGSWDLVVVDRLATSLAELRRFSRWGVPVGVDEGGAARSRFPLLIDTLPALPGTSPPNRRDTGYLDLPPPLRERPRRIASVLLSFGGEDPAGLTPRCAAELLRAGFAPEALTAVKGPLYRGGELPEGLRVLEAPESLYEQFAIHDLVCTSFGLTAYEAAAAGSLVLLINPGRYHRRLARAAGFPSAGTGRVRRRRFRSLLSRPEQLAAAAEAVTPPEGRSLDKLLLTVSRPAAACCPVCGRRENRALLREEERSFFTCAGCSVVYQLDFAERGERYGHEYFFREYRRQYGRSYLEDVPHIRQLSAARVRRLRRLAERGGGSGGTAGTRDETPDAAPRLLDVGCAYGPFLQEAAEGGFCPEGTDISPEATEYVRAVLGFPAAAGAFEEYPAEPAGRFDAVTMWFVIEHFADVDAVLRKVSALLRRGGLFAFSTPNLRGGSGRFYPRRFLLRSPADHHTLWSPRMARRVLRRYGFRVREVVSTGHHPERLPGAGDRPGGLRRGLLGGLSRLAGLGDTFEVYAEKKGEPQ